MSDGPPEASPGLTHDLPDAGSEPDSWRVTAPDVGKVRRAVRAAAHDVGLDPDQTDRFVVAVNEVVINALQHGGGVVEVTIGRGSDVMVTVADNGPGLAVDAPSRLPPPDQENGRGLWLVRHLCDDVSIDGGPDGTRVRLRATAR